MFLQLHCTRALAQTTATLNYFAITSSSQCMLRANCLETKTACMNTVEKNNSRNQRSSAELFHVILKRTGKEQGMH